MSKRGPVVRIKQEKKWDIHPVWRGIGVIMIVIIPLMSFTIATIVINEYPAVFLQLPSVLTKQVDLGPFGVVGFFWGKIGLSVLLSVFLYSVMYIVYSIVYGAAAGNMRYGPTDVTAKEYRQSLKEMEQRTKRKRK